MADAGDVIVARNETTHRFETIIDGHTAFLQYHQPSTGGSISLVHTEVPKDLEGRGIAGKLTRASLEYARQAHLKVVPLCPFTATYIQRHPEYLELVAEKYRNRVTSPSP